MSAKSIPVRLGWWLAHKLYRRVIALGHGRSGTHALMLAHEDSPGTTVPMLPATKM